MGTYKQDRERAEMMLARAELAALQGRDEDYRELYAKFQAMMAALQARTAIGGAS